MLYSVVVYSTLIMHQIYYNYISLKNICCFVDIIVHSSQNVSSSTSFNRELLSTKTTDVVLVDSGFTTSGSRVNNAARQRWQKTVEELMVLQKMERENSFLFSEYNYTEGGREGVRERWAEGERERITEEA